jgi:hypothetical protein
MYYHVTSSKSQQDDTKIPLILANTVLNSSLHERIKRCTARSVEPLGYGLDDRGIEIRFPAGARDFLFSVTSIPILEPTQLVIQWVPGAVSPGVQRPGREAGCSFSSSAVVKNAGGIPSPHHTSSWRDAQLINRMDNFTLPS